MSGIILRRLCVKILNNGVKGLNNNRNLRLRPFITVIPQQNDWCPTLQFYRTKKTKHSKKMDKKAAAESDEEDEEESTDVADQFVDKHTRIMDMSVPSLRVDVILKTGLSAPRTKIEEAFYESRIRVNGKKIFKKSELVQEGDEIDLVKSVDINNPNFLNVGRVELLSATIKGDGYKVKLKRCKNLLIENYEEAWEPA